MGRAGTVLHILLRMLLILSFFNAFFTFLDKETTIQLVAFLYVKQSR